jgi:RNA polymerase sigma-70 factor (ECF subfamily)
MEDNDLVGRVIENNDHQAFAQLVERYQKMVVTTCRGFVQSYADAEDLAQDVFIELFESLPSFRNESKLSTWIYRIAVNKSLNFVRRRKREVLLGNLYFWNKDGESSAHAQTIYPEGEQAMMNSERSRLLRMAINKLSENQRVALILSRYQELSYKEIADVMGVSVSSVESLLFRAKENLRKLLLKGNNI